MARNYRRKSDIKVIVDIVGRDDIPSDFYLPRYNSKKDWYQFFHFKFSNKFEYYMGSNKSYVDGLDLMSILSVELDIVKESSNPFKFKQKLKKEYDSVISLKDAVKVYNWYKNKQHYVEKIINQFMAN